MSKEKLLRRIRQIEPKVKLYDVFRNGGMWYWREGNKINALGQSLPVAINQVESLIARRKERKDLRIIDLYPIGLHDAE